jgi:hypothetical protein
LIFSAVLRWCACACIAIALVPAAHLHAQPQRSVPAAGARGSNNLVVDVVRLKSGLSLHGAALAQSGGVLTMAVDRAWLRRVSERYYESAERDEAALAREALVQLQERIPAWKAERPNAPRLAKLLDDELARIERGLNGPLQTQFMLVDLPRAKIERTALAPPARRQVALLAWHEQLADVEGRTEDSLRRELKERRIDPEAHRVDLSAELPPRPQTDAQWAARRALVEYVLLRPIDFQGTGDALFQTGEGVDRPQTGALLAAVLQSQLTSQLAELLAETAGAAPPAVAKQAAIDAVRRKVEQLDGAGFKLSRVSFDGAGAQVTVECQFHARLPGSGWQVIWQSARTVDARAARDEVERRVRQDPAVKKLLELLGAAAGDQLDQALRAGAASLEALEECQERFGAFLEPHLRRLDTPPLFLDNPAR